MILKKAKNRFIHIYINHQFFTRFFHGNHLQVLKTFKWDLQIFDCGSFLKELKPAEPRSDAEIFYETEPMDIYKMG